MQRLHAQADRGRSRNALKLRKISTIQHHESKYIAEISRAFTCVFTVDGAGRSHQARLDCLITTRPVEYFQNITDARHRVQRKDFTCN